MRRYRRRSNQKFKSFFKRLLFVLLSAVLIAGLAVLTGNLLKNKVENATERLEAIQPVLGNAVERNDSTNISENIPEQYTAPEVYASGIILKNHSTDDSLVFRINTIAETYDTVSVTLTDEQGIVYTSPALLDALRIPKSQSDSSYQSLISLCTAAKAKNLRISGVLSSSLSIMESETAALVDATLATELYSIGFHEVLFNNIISEKLDKENITDVKEYLTTIRESTPYDLMLGTILPISMYTDVEYARHIQMIASIIDFLAVDLTSVPVSSDDPSQSLEKICLALQGSFQVYNTRIVLANPDISQLAEQYSVLTRMELTNIHFLGEITPSILSAAYSQVPDNSSEDTTDETDAVDSISPQRNPYATSGKNSSDENKGGKDSAETYYQSGDAGSSWY